MVIALLSAACSATNPTDLLARRRMVLGIAASGFEPLSARTRATRIWAGPKATRMTPRLDCTRADRRACSDPKKRPSAALAGAQGPRPDKDKSGVPRLAVSRLMRSSFACAIGPQHQHPAWPRIPPEEGRKRAGHGHRSPRRSHPPAASLCHRKRRALRPRA